MRPHINTSSEALRQRSNQQPLSELFMPKDRPLLDSACYSRRELFRLAGLSSLGLALPSLLSGCGGNNGGNPLPVNYVATVLDARTTILEALAAEHGPSAVSVALVDDRRILWAEAFGYLNKRTGVAPTTETLFGLASGSKVFAAIAILILVDRGLVDLDTPLVHYVPAFRMADGRYTEITLRMLLSHSSGLPGTDYRNASTFVPLAGHVEQILASLLAQRLKHDPGEMAVYCNDGFSLIELVVAAVTGLSYTDFVTRAILTPLEMTHSRFGHEPLPSGGFATTLNAQGEPNPQEYMNNHATGGLYTTPRDLGRLAMLLLNGGRLGQVRLLSPAAMAELGTDQSATLPLNPLGLSQWGLGWDFVRQPGLAAVGVTAWAKNGGSNYFGTQFDLAPEERLGVIVMRVGGGLDAGLLAERILLHALAERGSIAGVPQPVTPSLSPPVATSEAERLGMCGAYAGMYLDHLEDQDPSLAWYRGFDGQWQEVASGLRRRQGGDWMADSHPEWALFVVEADGHRHLAQRYQAGLKHYQSVEILGQALSPLPPLSAKWQGRAGKSWLKVNDPYGSFSALGSVPPLFLLWQDPSLPGYLIVSGYPIAAKAVDPSTSDERALWCGKVAARDLYDVIIVAREGEEWLRVGSSLYRPLASVPALAAGPATITLSAEGLGEWRQLPASARLGVSGANSWFLYDSDLNLMRSVIQDQSITQQGTGAIPAGAYLVVYGEPNTTIQVEFD